MTFRKVDSSGNVYYATADVEFSYQNKKMLTLYGPPGTGKSTMARVIAKQCGYEPREINASDLRSADDLIDAMKNALTQNSHFGASKKPVCLIVDEVDGAANGGIGGGFGKVADFLKRCLNKTKRNMSTEAAEGDDKQTKKKKDDGTFEIRRPIIFVCNDLYAKAIRPLKEMSLQVKIAEADRGRLVQRLR